jgi:hypothetical protein
VFPEYSSNNPMIWATEKQGDDLSANGSNPVKTFNESRTGSPFMTKKGKVMKQRYYPTINFF